MAFSEIDRHRIKKEVGGLCSQRTPNHDRDKLRFEYDIEKQNVIINEVRPAWNNPKEPTKLPFAKLTYVKSRNIWKLYWKRASGKWERYEPKDSDKDLGALVQEIDKDPYGCFFG
jgi:hypothetical protein